MTRAASPFSHLLSPSLIIGASGLLAFFAACSGGPTGDPGTACAVACPTGSQCVDGNICVADDANPLRLDLKVHRVSGVVRGDDPTLKCPPGQEQLKALSLSFFDADQQTGATVSLACRPDGSFGFTADLLPGRYDVSATTGTTSMTLLKALEIRGDRQDLQLDLRIQPTRVFGPLLLNGLPANYDQTCSLKGAPRDITFVDKQTGASYPEPLFLNCSVANSVGYLLKLPLGTYRVTGSVQDRFVAAEDFTIDGPSVMQPLNLLGFQLGPKLTLNGTRLGAPTACAKAPDPAAAYPLELNFTAQDGSGANLWWEISCSALESGFKVSMPPGTYQVVARPDPSFFPSLPPWLVGAAPLVVSGDQYGVNLDLRAHTVSGRVSLGRAQASLCGATAQSPGAVVLRFYDVTAGNDTDVFNRPLYQQRTLPCDNGPTLEFQTGLAPGTYTLGLSPADRLGTPRTDPVLLRAALTVDADRSGVLVQPTLARLTGRLLIADAPPAAPGCQSNDQVDDQVMVDLAFRERQSGALTVVPIRCADRDSFQFQADLAPGTYDVSVGANAAPPAGFEWPPRRWGLPLNGMVSLLSGLLVSGDRDDLQLALRPRVVRGTLTVNGAPPAAPPGCAGQGDQTMVSLSFQTEPGVRFDVPIPCSAAADFSFSQPLAAGLYRVSLNPTGAKDDTSPTGLPKGYELPLVNQLLLR